MPTKASRTSRGAGRSAAVARHARDFLRRSRGENIAEAAVREVREEAGFNPSMIRAGDDFMFGVAEPYEMYERLCIITGCRQTRVHLTFSFH